MTEWLIVAAVLLLLLVAVRAFRRPRTKLDELEDRYRDDPEALAELREIARAKAKRRR